MCKGCLWVNRVKRESAEDVIELESAAGSSGAGGVLGGAMAAAMGGDPRAGIVGLNVQLSSSNQPSNPIPSASNSYSKAASAASGPSGLSLALSNVGMPQVPVEKPYGCGDCGKHFKRKDHLNRHRARTFHNSEPPPPIKSMPAPSLLQFQAPTMVQQPPPPQPPRQMHREQQQMQMQPRHGIQAQHQQQQQQQNLPLSQQFKAVAAMDNSPMNRFPCPEQGCTKSFKSSYHLRRHHTVHTRGGGASSYIPPEPPRQSRASSSGQNKPKFECRICGTKLSRAEHLTRHQRRLHADKETLESDPKMAHYSCTICGKQCFDSHKLKVHMHNAHLDDAPFECEYCNKKFKAAANLRRHQKIHEKGAQAQVAGKAAGSSSQQPVNMRQQPGTSKNTSALQAPVHLGQPGQYFQVQATGQGGTPIIIQVQNPHQQGQFRPLNQVAGTSQQQQPNNRQTSQQGQSSGVSGWPTAYAWPVQATAAIGGAAAAAPDWPWATWTTNANPASNPPKSDH